MSLRLGIRLTINEPWPLVVEKGYRRERRGDTPFSSAIHCVDWLTCWLCATRSICCLLLIVDHCVLYSLDILTGSAEGGTQH